VAAFCLGASLAACRGESDVRTMLVAEGEDLMIESFGARRIVRLGETSFIGYAEKLGDGWQIRVRGLNHNTGQLSGPFDVAPGTDNHSIMGLVADSRGILHCVSGGHGPLTYVRSLRPADPSEWTPPVQIATEGTYAMLMIDRADRMYVFYRHESRNLALQTCEPGGEWQPTRIIGTTVSGLVFYIMGVAIGSEEGQQSLHIAGHFYGHPEECGKPWPREAYGYRVMPWYIRSRDGGQTWETAGGESLVLPISEETIDIPFDLDEPYDIPWSVDVTVDEANRPHVLCAWAYRNPGPELSYREVQGEIQKLPSRLWELTWENGRWVRNPVMTPALVDHHLMLPAAVFSGGKLHLAVTTRATAALQSLGASHVRELWHLWARPGGNWRQEFVAGNNEFTNNWKLPDESGELELLWRGAPESGGARAAIWYATGLAASQ